MLTLIYALLAGIGFQELMVAIIIFGVPLFFLVRWILRKIWKSGTREATNAIAVILALILAPIFFMATGIAIMMAYGGH